MSLETADKEAAAHAVKPRVTLADIEAAIERSFYFTGSEAAYNFDDRTPDAPSSRSLETLTICLVVMRNGFTIIGKSAPASPKNFDAEFGRKLAYEDAIRQLWPLMGFALRDRLAFGPH